MKINPITSVLTGIARSKAGQSIYKALINPKNETLVNNGLPLLEGVVSTASYCVATATNKSIPDERKPILQSQNIINGIAGITVSGALNAVASKKAQQVVDKLDPKKIPNIRAVKNGVKIGVPILVTTLVMRYGISTLSVPMSALCKKLFDKKDSDKKLDVKG